MREEYDFSRGTRGKYAGKVSHAVVHTDEQRRWRNRSVKLLAGNRDPIEVVREKAREIVLAAMDAQIVSMPIDPMKLAESLGIKVVPNSDVREARTIAGSDNKALIEYNPGRPKARIRFSICHEIAHTLFPDCLEQARYRGFHVQRSSTAPELELLCNVAAAEFLLPLGSIQADLDQSAISIDAALRLRVKYEASIEAVLWRLLGLTASKCAVFAASAEQSERGSDPRYRVEYVRSTPGWNLGVARGDYLPQLSVARECTAVGVTAKGLEDWTANGEKLRVEMVGTSPYPEEDVLPRVVGILRPVNETSYLGHTFELLRGDALKPRGGGKKIVAHVVNDKTANWGAGFGRAVQAKWPEAQQHFKSIMERMKGSKLGLTSFSRVEDEIYTFQMICQRGYGPSATTRLRYESLRRCLVKLKEVAEQEHATVHMPKIGVGEAGGSWGLISNLIAEELCAKGVPVTVYELPGTAQRGKVQGSLFDQANQL